MVEKIPERWVSVLGSERSLSCYVPSTRRRLGAFFLDQIIMLPFYIPFFGALTNVIFGDDATVSLSTFVLILLVPAIYEFVFLLSLQATPGKLILGLKVVPAHDLNDSLHWQESLLRALAKRLELFVGMSVYALAFFKYDRTHLADWLSETRVVQGIQCNKPAKIRWFIGAVLVVYFFLEGVHVAQKVMRGIDWENSRVQWSQVTSAIEFDDSDVEDEESE